jgi:alkanesulfonate monooxygenase SsuD/methylene tetrahydromethanopterin reductase-like flavin-dependent oxidoreductase (luciferase family)
MARRVAVRIGYLIDVHGGPYDQPVPDRDDVVRKLDAMIEEGLLAERYGFHSLQVPHRHGRTETYFPGPLQLLTILARETERVGLGTFTLISTLLHPMLVAEQCSIIDNLSRGRLSVSLGRGYHEDYWKYFGIPRERLLGRHLEAVAILKEAIKGERFTYEGEWWQVEESLLSPQPYQEGGFPIWGAGDSPPAMARAATYGEAWCCSPFPLQKEYWDETVGVYRERARELGKKPFVVLMRDGWVADDFATAARIFGEPYVEDMRFYQRQGIFEHHPDFTSEESLTAESLRGHAVMGSPQDCIEQLERYENEFGVDYVLMRFREPTGPSFEQTAEAIQRFGEEVVSHFHRRDPEPPTHPAIPEGARW